MKKLTLRLIALVLCAAMLLSMVGCHQQQEQIQPTETTAPTEPPAPSAVEIYAQAKAPVSAASDLTLNITTTKTTTVAGEVFEETSRQKLSYLGLGTETMQMTTEDTVEVGGETTVYQEVFADGVLYVTVDEEQHFSGEMTAEDVTGRFIPALLVDETLYASVTSEASGTATVITFSQPTAAEVWAMPEGAELVDASGTAFINSSGELRKNTYTITYSYGPTEVTLEVEAYITLETAEITLPEDPDAYTKLEYVDAVRLFEQGICNLYQADTLMVSSIESMYCQAAGFVRNMSYSVNMYARGTKDMMAKIGTNIYVMDYSTRQNQRYELEEIFRDGKYTAAEDGGDPVPQSGITAAMIETYTIPMLVVGFASSDFWKEVTAEDLGSVYYMEITYTDEMGEKLCDTICTTLWNDPEFLDNLATAYETTEMVGYFAIDKYTGLPTAAGYKYVGMHTVDGVQYELSFQLDQSAEAPALEVYKEITDTLPEEVEPEQKATPLFYHVTGEDGQEMWLLGTIHIGDERTAFLPQEIYDAFNASDALALEFNMNAFEDKMDEDEEFSDKISDYYFYSDGTTIEDHIDAELYTQALKYLKASGNHNMNANYLKASMWGNSIDNFHRRQGYDLQSAKGVDNRLMTMAEEKGMEILDIETGESQVAMMTGYSDELQEILLEESISYNAAEYWESTRELYELWCSGDEAALREKLSDEVDTSEFTEEEMKEYEEQKPLMDEYNTAMSYKRNDAMLEVAIGYLESGKTVFYAVGLAHLLNDVNGLVDALREAGYTVELVTYAD